MEGESLNLIEERIQQLRRIFPDVFSEGKIDFNRLRAALGENVLFPGEHYELDWAGKAEARREVQRQTTATLIPDPDGSFPLPGKTGEEAQNIFIEGENLETLRVLQKSYFGKVKMIYIDPPYNTGNDSFVYPDDFAERQEDYLKRTGAKDQAGFLNKQDLWKKNSKENGQFHSVWLSMMYPRLYLARNLMREDGVIFVSIDDNEVANLRLLMDEVFGEENFVGQIIWKNATDNNPTNIATEHEYLLCYTKNKTSIHSEWKSGHADAKEVLTEIGNDLIKKHKDLSSLQSAYSSWFKQNKQFLGQLDRYKYIDFDGVYTGSQSVHNPGKEGYRYDIPHPKTGKPCKQPLMGYRFPSETMDEMLKSGKILFGEDESKLIEIKVYAKDFRDKLSSVIELDGRLGAYNIRELFKDNVRIFNNPKPVIFIKNIIPYIIEMESEEIILDFFAGSGTTAQAVLELNAEDGGNRRFILVQMPEPLEENNEAWKSGYRSIADIRRARIRKVIERLQAQAAEKAKTPGLFEASENGAGQAPGFRSYRLRHSNFKVWRNDLEGKEAILNQLQIFQEPLAEYRGQHQALLVELVLKAGLPLTVEVSETAVDGCPVFDIDKGRMWVALDKVSPAVFQAAAAARPAVFVALGGLFAGAKADETMANAKLQLKDAGVDFKVI